MELSNTASFVVASMLFSSVTAIPQFPGWDGYGNNGGYGPGGSGGPPDWNNGNNPNDPSNGGATSTSSGQFSAFADATRSNVNHILAAHAILACLAWLFFVPTGGIILRLGINSPWVVRVHAICQVLSYGVYMVAAAMGVWLANTFSGFANIWTDPHPILGLVILVVALSQPLTGLVHHRRYKRALAETQNGGAKPGRSGLSRFHVTVGRLLMLLAMVNGGLGLRLAGITPLQSAGTTKNAKVIYAVLSAWMGLLYIGIVWSAEARKKRSERAVTGVPVEHKTNQGLPSYDESQESLGEGN